MALDFPTGPEVVDGYLYVYTDPEGAKIYYYYNATDKLWYATTEESCSNTSVGAGPIPPEEPKGGSLWWDNSDGRLYVFYAPDLENAPEVGTWVAATPETGAGSLNYVSPADLEYESNQRKQGDINLQNQINQLGTAFVFRGNVDATAVNPPTSAEGDIYNNTAAGSVFGTEWSPLTTVAVGDQLAKGSTGWYVLANGTINVEYPVVSVNNKTGAVQLTASDVGALGATDRAQDSQKLDGLDSEHFLNVTSNLESLANVEVTNGQNGQVLVFRGGKWLNETGGGGSGGARVSISGNPPENPAQGEFWWSTQDGVLYIWYDQGTSRQWVPATPIPGGGQDPNAPTPEADSGSGAKIWVGQNPPQYTLEEGMLWWCEKDATLYIYFDQDGQKQWVPATPIPGGDGSTTKLMATVEELQAEVCELKAALNNL